MQFFLIPALLLFSVAIFVYAVPIMLYIAPFVVLAVLISLVVDSHHHKSRPVRH